MRQMRKISKKLIITIVAIAAVFACLAFVKPTLPKSAADRSDPQTTLIAYSEWIDKYPAEYASFNVTKTRNGANHGHTALLELMENSIAAGVEPNQATCIACKSTAYNTLYDKYGTQLYSMTLDDVKSDVDAYWDCGMCHTDIDSLTLKADIGYFDTLAGDTFAKLPEKDLLCGQCHNSLYTYRKLVADGRGSTEDFEPYVDGYSAQSLYDTRLKDGAGVSTDLETGAIMVAVGVHPDIEIFADSNHSRLGLDCTSCHMQKTETDDGQTITNHNASGSPLESDETLELCLKCHKNQGIETASQMREFVENAQNEFTAEKTEVDERIASLRQLLVDATSDGTTDPQKLAEARSYYSRAQFYVDFATAGGTEAGTKIAHNPDYMRELLDQANGLAEQGADVLS